MKAFASTFMEMRRRVPERFLLVVDQAEKGSLRAAIKLTCLDCAACQASEIEHCPITACALFPHRPYQDGLEEADHAVEPDDEDNDEGGEADFAMEPEYESGE
jgi:hypothetical protein